MSTVQHQLNMGNRVSVDPEAGTITASRILRQSGNSTVLTIPPQLLDGAGLEAGDSVKLVADMETGELTISEFEESE